MTALYHPGSWSDVNVESAELSLTRFRGEYMGVLRSHGVKLEETGFDEISDSIVVFSEQKFKQLREILPEDYSGKGVRIKTVYEQRPWNEVNVESVDEPLMRFRGEYMGVLRSHDVKIEETGVNEATGVIVVLSEQKFEQLRDILPESYYGRGVSIKTDKQK